MELIMQRWFSGPLGTALVRLLNMSAAAGVLICVVVLLRLVLRRAPKWTRGILWAIVAVQLVCPMTLRSPLSVYRLLPRSDAVKSDQVEVFRAGGGSEKPLLVLEAPQIAGYDSPVQAAPASGARPETAPEAEVKAAPSVFLPTAGAVWLAGFALMLLYVLISALTLRLRVRASVPLEEKPFRLCDSVETPFILGVLRPRVYLPAGLSDTQRAAVAAHEKAHLRRRDHWWKVLGWLLLAVHWFNPLVWLAYALLCRDIELACDEKAVRDMDAAARADYSQALLDCAAPRVLLRVCPLAFGEVGIRARIRAVLNYKKPAFWIILLAVVVCIVVGICFLTRPGPIEVPDPSKTSVMPTAEPTKSAVTPTPEPTQQPAPERIEWPAVDPDRSKVYWLDDSFYGDDPFHSFSITLDMEAGTFQYYETPISSYFGFGRFARDGDILTIDDSGDGTRVNRFRMTDDGEKLIWIEDGSNNFHFVHLTDGAAFSQKRYTLRSGVYEGQYFSIRIDAEAGTFRFSESDYSSHISAGYYGLSGNILTLDDAWPSSGMQPAVRSNRFRVEPDRLVWLAEGSDNFVFVTLSDGAVFQYREGKPRMTLDDVRALARKGEALTWEDLLVYDGEDVGSGYIRHFLIDEQYLLSVSDGKRTGTPQKVILMRADDDGIYRSGAGFSIDIRTDDVEAFLSRPSGPFLTVISGGQSAAAVTLLLHERDWADDARKWIAGDGPPVQELLKRPDQIPTLTLADDFELSFGGGAVRKSPLIVYDDQLNRRRDDYPGDSALNWLAPGTWYCGVEVHGPLGRYIAGEDAYEESVYVCVFRLVVPEGERPAAYAPAEAHDLVKASLHILGEDHSVTDAAALAQLQLWLSNATELPSAGCPFSSVLTLTRADGSEFSLCPAEDSCGVVFADGKYYRYAADNTAFLRMFGVFGLFLR